MNRRHFQYSSIPKLHHSGHYTTKSTKEKQENTKKRYEIAGTGPFGACPYRPISQSHGNFKMTAHSLSPCYAGAVILGLDRRIQ